MSRPGIRQKAPHPQPRVLNSSFVRHIRPHNPRFQVANQTKKHHPFQPQQFSPSRSINKVPSNNQIVQSFNEQEIQCASIPPHYPMPVNGNPMHFNLQGATNNQHVVFNMSYTFEVQSPKVHKTDADMISQLVLSAKQGEWENVWEVLDNKPHLVNCIPSERAWSVLHQAVWHNNVQAVMKILSYPACDSEIRTKQDQTCESGPGKKPVELAKSQQIKDILQSHQGRKVMNEEAPTMLPVDNMLNILGGCIYMTLSCNHGVLIPPRWPIEDHNTVHSIPYIMEAIFRHTNAGDNWIKARNNVSLTLQQYSKPLGDKLWRGDELVEDTKHKFFSRIIKLYTEDLRQICSVVNKMLRLQDTGIFQYQPSSLELSLCPYALLLNAILLHWQKLDGYTGLTYRSCSLTQEQASEYVQGQQFVWLSFSSSSKRKGAFLATNYSYDASAYEFIIDNGAYNHKWAPRGITKYSGFPMEEECLYPFGAKFQVTDVVFNQIQIRLIDY